jgi:epoxide hydrolase-like predicted phosphatase
MTIRAVYFDAGGVILRTEYQAPRQHLAERLGLEYEALIKLVFDSESARLAAIGKISEEQHWSSTVKSLGMPASALPSLREEFFAGDILDLSLLNYIRSLRGRYKVGLISNAWSGLRDWLLSRKVDQSFDQMIISAEEGVAKPDARIYQIALERLGAEADESVFLDDFIENVEGARAVGLQAIHFIQPEQALEELKRLLANHH